MAVKLMLWAISAPAMPCANKDWARLPVLVLLPPEVVVLKVAVPALASMLMPEAMVAITDLRSPACEMAASTRP